MSNQKGNYVNTGNIDKRQLNWDEEIDSSLLSAAQRVPSHVVIQRNNIVKMRKLSSGSNHPNFQLSQSVEHQVVHIDSLSIECVKNGFVDKSLPESATSNHVKKPLNHSSIALHCFSPSSHAESTNEPLPILLFCHGGGYVMGAADDSFAALIASECHCLVLSVDYRLAPEFPFPCALNDASSALVWLMNNALTLNGDVSRLVLGGSSAGAGIAAGLTLFQRDTFGFPIKGQWLLYPMLNARHDTPSGHIENYPIWTRQNSLNAWEMYLNGQQPSAYSSPSMAHDLSNLPKTSITIGEADLFLDECELFHHALKSAGTESTLDRIPKMYHAGERLVLDADVSVQMRENYFSRLRALF